MTDAPSMRCCRRTFVGLTLGFLVLLGLDLGSRWFVRGNTFQGHALPPFGALTNPKQLRWLERLEQPADERVEQLFLFDAELGWTHRPASQSSDGLYTTNSLGARGRREYEPEPPAGTLRIACFGDSFTMGTDVADDEAYPALFEELDASHEALNFGVGGYGTDQALLRFRRTGRHGAHVVAIGIMLENVGRNVNRYRPLWFPSSASCGVKPRFRLVSGELELVPQPFADELELVLAVRDGSVVERVRAHEFWFENPRVPTGRVSSLVRILYSRLAVRARDPERLWAETKAEPFLTSVALLETFHREALESGARAAPVLVFPTRDAFSDLMTGGESWWGTLVAELGRRGIPCLDLAVPLAEWARSADVGGDLDLVFTDKNHLSGPANAVVARTLYRWIERSP